MNDKILKHYLEFSQYTYPGCYLDVLKRNLPNDIRKIGLLVRQQILHRVMLGMGITDEGKVNNILRESGIPWYRQPEDDNFPTVSAMLAELYRRDKRGLIPERAEKDKLVLTCRFVSILMASLLKTKGIPTRIRSGFAPYFKIYGKRKVDHWINQYWDSKKKGWITIDVDGSKYEDLTFDPYNIPEGVFCFSAGAWINIRRGIIDENLFWNAGGYEGLIVVAWELFYDFHSLMNNEVIYFHHPECVLLNNFQKLSEKDLKEIDKLAYFMQKPDDNFDQLKKIWETNRKLRLLKGGLL